MGYIVFSGQISSGISLIEDDMYVSSIKGKSANANLLSFSVSGLKPGTSYSVTMKVYLLYTPMVLLLSRAMFSTVLMISLTKKKII